MRTILIILTLVSFSLAQWSHSPVAVNSSPGVWNVHYSNSHRAIARIGTTIIVIVHNSAGEQLYRSTNNGSSWTQIYNDNGVTTGCIISGPDSTFYYFCNDYSNDRILMVKFDKDDTSPSATTIYSNASISDNTSGTYRFTSATVDSTGKIYVCATWGNPEQVYLLSSTDYGETWFGPYQVSVAGTAYYYACVDITPDNLLYVTYSPFDPNYPIFAKSTDGGQNWTRTTITMDKHPNPQPVCMGDRIYVFTQGPDGVQCIMSDDEGATWGSWYTVNTTCGYGDPSPAVGSDSTVYAAFRSNDGTGLTEGSCGDQSQYRMARSTTFGVSWAYPDDFGYDFAERACEHAHIRYQTWFNYGGPLEWVFYQYTASATQYVTYYDINTDVDILTYEGGSAPAAPASLKKFKLIEITDTK